MMQRVFLLLAVCPVWLDVSETFAAPAIPGFARFYSSPDTDQVEAGRFLFAELNCARCHEAGEFKPVHERRAPNLDRVGSRIEPEYLRKYLNDPQAMKPGSLMPRLFAGLSESERERTVEALVHFLASTGRVHQIAPNTASVRHGKQVFEQVGCIACHGSLDPKAPALVTSVPLGNLGEKYSIPSLMQFLKDPHAIRPSGRMPNLNLNDQDARDIANYFLRDVDVPGNIAYKVYEGGWDKLPDFGRMKPKTEGVASGFDLGVAGKKNNFGIRFEGFLQIETEGEYKFVLGSDDGSRLSIDGEAVVDVDGIHPHQVKRGRKTLSVGAHPVRIDYFQGGGEWTLEAAFEGPGVARQPLAAAITLTREKPEGAKDEFRPDPELVRRGRELFASVGCANCHEMKADGQLIGPMFHAPALAKLNASEGCLGTGASGKAPDFSLSDRQRSVLGSALAAGVSGPPAEGERAVFQTMMTFNCYACHERNEVGGVERAREAEFVGTTQEMGDEGRIPPSLTGVGDKLNDRWLEHILNNGASDRPYMLTRMPKFGADHVRALLKLLPQLDRKTLTTPATFEEPDYRVKADGRHLVGEKGMSCIKCHPFGNKKSTGIQALNLQQMTTRLREDWFNRYMLDPQAYRRGTRMPSAWPNGRSIVPDVLGGDTQKQLTAIWKYLSDGANAAVPIGVGGQMIVLEPETTPIIYRNFIQGISPRGIAVGYPEGVNLAFDAQELNLRLIWHGAFIDAGKHWVGRGPGAQSPLGDHIVQLPGGMPFAELESRTASWPDGDSRRAGYKFLGYQLDKKQRPTFRYEFGKVTVADTPIPVKPEAGHRDGTFSRELILTADGVAPENLYFRIATGNIEIRDDDSFVLDRIVKLSVPGGTPFLRESGGHKELLVPVTFTNGKARLRIDYVW